MQLSQSMLVSVRGFMVSLLRKHSF